MLYHDIDINHSIHIDIPVESYNKSIQFNTSVSQWFQWSQLYVLFILVCDVARILEPKSKRAIPPSGVCRNLSFQTCCSMLLIFPGLLTLIMASDGRPDHWFVDIPKKLKIFQRWLRTKNLPVRKLKSGHGHKLNFVDGSLQFQVNSHHDLKHDGLAPSNAEHRHPTSDRVVWCFLAQCCTG